MKKQNRVLSALTIAANHADVVERMKGRGVAAVGAAKFFRRRLRRRKAHRAIDTDQQLTQMKNLNSILSCSVRRFAFILGLAFMLAGEVAAEPPALPTKHTTRNIEGWSVRVDYRLTAGDKAALGERALKLLMARLVAITIVVPEPALSKLRAVNIELDFDYGDLHAMQYHPDAGWLKEHGYSEALAKCVHIPDVEDFLSPFENHRMPWVVLHELAHGYHDQVLGFENPRVEAVWKMFCDSGKYKSVLTSPGHMCEHYGLTDAKEFFAEMTESYFGSNDFYPFVAGELKQAEPEIFTLMSDLWGKLPEPPKRKAPSKP